MERPSRSDAIKYILIAVFSSYGIVLLGFVGEMLIGLLVGEQIPLSRLLDCAFTGPTFAVPVCMGLAFGYFAGPKAPKLSSRLAFMVPLAIGVWEVTGWIRYQYPGEVLRVSLVDNFLTANCGSSECLYELGITAPLVSSLAFAVGAELRWIVVQKKARVHPSVH